MHDHDPDDAEMRAWLAGGKAPHGVCPYCGSTISVTQRDCWFRARCSHRGCGASGPQMRQIGRAVEMLARPPAYVARHMGVHPSSLTDVVSVLEHDRDAATARAEQAEAEREDARAALTRCVLSAGDGDLPEVAEGRETIADTPATLAAYVCTTIAGLRTAGAAATARAEQAEAERDEARDLARRADAIALGMTINMHGKADERDAWRERAKLAEAEVARLRGEQLSSALAAGEAVRAIMQTREAALREAAGALRDAAKKHRNDAEASRSVAASGGHVLAADVLDSYANVIDLLDAAPAESKPSSEYERGLREAAACCEALRNELYRRADRANASDAHKRNAIAGTVALDKVAARIIALAPPAAETVSHAPNEGDSDA